MPKDEAILVQYLRRAYHVVDGLWFMKVEEATDFDQALELDRRVWEVVAKIQVREARRLLDCKGNSPAELARCLALKFAADGHEFETTETAGGLRVIIRHCPWQELLKKSDRQHLAAQVAQTICPTEGQAWCAEFGGAYEFEMSSMACQGADHCEWRFRAKR